MTTQQQEKCSEASNIANDAFSSVCTIKALGVKDALVDSFSISLIVSRHLGIKIGPTEASTY